jgi:hypothetical protein
MTSRQVFVAVRWFLVPIAALSGIIAALLPWFVVTRIVHDILWNTGNHMPGKVFLGYYSIPVFGAFAAFFFVVFGTWCAPKHRFIVAHVLLVTGGALAWICVGNWHSPITSERIWAPILATYWGGLLACNIVCFRGKLRRMFRRMRNRHTNRRATSL